MADTESGELRGDGGALVACRGLAERGPEPPVGGVDAQRAARLGIDQGQLADVDERRSSRGSVDLDGEDRVAGRDLGQRASASRAGRGSRRRSSRGRRWCATRRRCAGRGDDGRTAALLGRLRRRGSGAGRACRCGRRPGGGPRGRGPAPKAMTPSRSERRATNRPTTRAAPSATSALRRSAVPKCIDADSSNRSHAVSWRSGTSSRTCGMRAARGGIPVDAADVVAGLVRPEPVEVQPLARGRGRDGRRSGEPPARRVSATSSRRTSSSAIGPGPGRAACAPARRPWRGRRSRGRRSAWPAP